jgi:hypothetical protein
MLFGLAMLALLAAGFSVIAAFGAHGVGEARWATAEAEARYLEVLDLHRSVVDRLAAEGASTTPLTEAWRRFDGAPTSERAVRAQQVYASLEAHTASSRAAKEAMDAIAPARDEYVRSSIRWREAAASPPGWLAISVGLATRPPPRSGP